MLKRIYSLIIKELLAVLKDKKSRYVLIIPPIVQLLIFSMAATLDVKNIALAVCNEDGGGPSIELEQRFAGSPVFSQLRYFDDVKKAEQALIMQEVSSLLHFDSRFSKDLLSGKPAKVQMLLDGRKSNSTQIVLGYSQKIITQFNDDLAQQPQAASVLIQRNWFNPNLMYQWFTVPGLIAILAMMTSLTVTALSVAREREIGTFEQLLVSPLTTLEILLGKAIPGLIIGLAEATLILAAGVFIFRIPFTGSLPALYFSLVIFISSVVGVGLFLSSFSKTQQQALLNVFFFVSPAVILSGFATPIENMPFWLQKITVVNPLKYFLIIARGTFLKEMHLADVITYTIPMAWIALFTLLSAAFFFKRKTN